MNSHSEVYKDCDIVLDLLPLYMEGKTGDESNALVKYHLEKCEECREIYGFMSGDYWKRGDLSEPAINVNGNPKKGRSRIRLTYRNRRWLLLLAGLIGYFCLMTGIVVYVFLYLTF